MVKSNSLSFLEAVLLANFVFSFVKSDHGELVDDTHHNVESLSVHLNTKKVVTIEESKNLKLVSISHHHHHKGMPTKWPDVHKTKCRKNVFGRFTKSELKYLRSLTRKVTYAPMASSEYYNMVTIFTTGEAIGEVDLGSLCIRRVWNLENMEMNLFVFNRKTILKCRQKHKRSILCSPKADPSYSVQISIAATDGETYAIVVGCMPDGVNFWFVASEFDTLTHEARTSILIKIQELGFDETKALVAPYTSCHGGPPNPCVVKPQPPPEVPDVPPPVYHPTCFNEKLANYDIVKQFYNINVYIPFGSQRFFEQISLLLTDKYLEDAKMKNACTWRTTVAQTKSQKLKLKLFGFHGSANVSCTAYHNTDGTQGFQCKSKGFHKLSWSSNALLTDGKDYILIGVCLRPCEHDWFVLSRYKKVDEGFKRKIQDKLLKIGFTQFSQNLKGIEVNYDNCARGEIVGPAVDPNPPHPSFTKCFRHESSLTKDEWQYFQKSNPKFYFGVTAEEAGQLVVPSGGFEGYTSVSSRSSTPKDCLPLFFINLLRYGRAETQGPEFEQLYLCSEESSGKDSLSPIYSCSLPDDKKIRTTWNVRPVLTDQKNFVLLEGCNDEEQDVPVRRMWFILSEQEVLDNPSKQLISKKLSSLAFTKANPEFKYSMCQEGQTQKPVTQEPTPSTEECFKGPSVLTTDEVKFFEGTRNSAYAPYTYKQPTSGTYIQYETNPEPKQAIRYTPTGCLALRWTYMLAQVQAKSQGRGFGPDVDFVCGEKFNSRHTLSPVYLCHGTSHSGGNFDWTIRPVLMVKDDFVLYEGCEKTGYDVRRFWFVMSKDDYIHDSSKQMIDDKVASMGLTNGPNNGYRICERKIPTCEADDFQSNISYDELIPIHKIYAETTYVPWGSSRFYIMMHTLLESGDTDLKNICLTRTWSEEGGLYGPFVAKGSMEISGFGTHQTFYCNHIKSQGDSTELYTECSKDGDKSFSYNAVLTDRNEYVLVIGTESPPACKKWWAVISKSYYISESIKKEVRAKLDSLGFPKEEIYEYQLNYDNCKPDTFEKTPNSCDNIPYRITEKDVTFIKEMSQKTTYIPWGSRQYYNTMSQFLQDGQGLEDSKTKLDKFCLTQKWVKLSGRSFTTTSSSLLINGFGENETLSCEYKERLGGLKALCSEKFSFDKWVEHDAVLTDQKEFVLMVGNTPPPSCSRWWAVVTTSPVVSESTKKKVLAKLDSLGISKNDRDELYLSYKKCGPKPESKNLCVQLLKTKSHFRDSDQYFIQEMMSKQILVPIASRAYLNAMSLLLRRDGFRKGDEKKICLTAEHNPETHELVLTGYGKSVTLKCRYAGVGDTKNPALLCKLGPDVFISASVIDTDGESSLLSVGCLGDGRTRIWSLLAPTDGLSLDASEAARVKLMSLKFRYWKEKVELDYSRCKLKTTPRPLMIID